MKLKNCKYCNEEIAVTAKNCPKCGGKNKKVFYKRPGIIILIIFVLFICIGSISDDNETVQTNIPEANSNINSEIKSEEISNTETTTEAPQITYTFYNVSDLFNDLENNALSANEKYKGQYVELKGELSVIDSNGKYISLAPEGDEFTFDSVHCYIKSDEQKSIISSLSRGDVITIKGKIKDVGEILGYSLDIDDILAQ